MNKVNTGHINAGGEYEKHVSFSKAVLWKDRQLSLRPATLAILKARECNVLNFIDDKKKEKWVFNLKDILESGVERRVGQEQQVYFPISLAKIIRL